MSSMIFRTSTIFITVPKQVMNQVIRLFKSAKCAILKFGKHFNKRDNLVHHIGAKPVSFLVFLVFNNQTKNIQRFDVLESLYEGKRLCLA